MISPAYTVSKVSTGKPSLGFFFLYRSDVVLLELVDPGRHVWAIACPVCGKRSALDLRVHRARVECLTGKVTIEGEVRCPNRVCGWAVKVREGIAEEAGDRPDFGLPTTEYLPTRRGKPLLWKRAPPKKQAGVVAGPAGDPGPGSGKR